MSNNITIKDATNANVVLHTIEDATSVHFNQSIPTDTANNTATVVSGGQAVASGMGALVVAQRDALPAGTNLLGGVSVRGISDVSVSPNGLNIPVSIAGTITVGTHAVTQSGTWNVGLNAGTNLVGAVSISPNGLNIPVSIANVVDVSLNGVVASVNNLGTIAATNRSLYTIGMNYLWDGSIWRTITGDTSGRLNVNASLGGSTALIGSVSISPNGLNVPVSLAPPTFNVPVSIATITGNIGVSVINPTFNLPVSVHPVTQSGTWNVGLNSGTNLVGAVSIRQIVSVQPDGTANWPVSIAGTPAVAQSGAWNVGLNAGTNLVGAVSISPNGLNIPVSIAPLSYNLPVSVHPVTQSGTWNVGLNAGTNHIGKVSVEGLSITGIGTQLVSVGGAVSTQGVQIVGRDGSGNARVPYVDASGIARVSIEGSLAVSGSSMTHTVGTAVTTEGYPMLGSDGTNSRRLLTTTGGALIVHVSNTAPGGGPGGSTMTQTVGAAVTTEGYPMLGTDGTNARGIRTDTAGRIEANVSLGGSTALIGSVSISPNGLNIPVSVANTINVATHAVTQSGTWNVGAVTSINSRVAVSVENVNNIAVSVAGTPAVAQSGTWNVGINAGTNLIGAVSVRGSIIGAVSIANIADVSVSPNGLNIPVSIAPPTFNVPVSVAQGRVSVNGIVTVAAAANFAAAIPAHGFPVGGEVSTGNPTFSSGVLAPLQLDANGRLKISGTITGGSMTHTVGTAVTTEGYPMLGSDGTNSRRLLTTTGGALVVHVSNTAPGGSTGGGTITASIGGAVSTQAVQIAGSDTQNNARTIKTNVSGAVFISTRTFMSQAVFTRPADTTAYAAGATAAPGNAGDLIANSTTNTAVVPLKFRVARSTGQNGGIAYIRGARMFRTGGGLATGQHNIAGAIRLHLFNTNNRVSVANGDNGAFNASPVSNWMGYIDLVAIACAPGLRTSGAVSTQVYWGAPARTGEMLVNLSATQVSIQGLLETRVAFTPISGEIFTVQIEGFNG